MLEGSSRESRYNDIGFEKPLCSLRVSKEDLLTLESEAARNEK